MSKVRITDEMVDAINNICSDEPEEVSISWEDFGDEWIAPIINRTPKERSKDSFFLGIDWDENALVLINSEPNILSLLYQEVTITNCLQELLDWKTEQENRLKREMSTIKIPRKLLVTFIFKCSVHSENFWFLLPVSPPVSIRSISRRTF